MLTRQVRQGLPLTAAALLAASLFGCAGQTHDEMVNDAEGRWHDVRSAIVVDMAETQFRAGQLELCEQSLEDGLAIDPDNPKLLTLYGRVKLEQGRLERAYHMFQAAIVVQDPSEAPPQPQQAEEHAQDRKKKRPQRQAQPTRPMFPDPYYYQGLVFQRWQQYDKALRRYEQAYEIEPDTPAYLMAMSEMLVSLDRVSDAIALLEGKLIYFDQNAGIRAAIGQLYAVKGDHGKAADMYRQAARLNPEDTKLKEELAYAQVGAQRYGDAVDTLEGLLLATKEMSQRDDLRRLLGETLIKAGRGVEARRVYEDLVKRPQVKADDWVRLGELCWKAGDDASTLHAANRSIRLAPNRHEGYLLAGLVWQKRQKLDEALRMYDRAAELAPQSAAPLILRGVALQKAGQPAAAADAYSEALKRQPDDRRALTLLKGVADATP